MYLAGFGGSLREKFGNFSRHNGVADVTDGGAQAASRQASRDAQSSNIEIGSRQAAANYARRRPVLPEILLWREGGDHFFEARIAAQRVASRIEFQVGVLPR
jgi:hypothetical protein